MAIKDRTGNRKTRDKRKKTENEGPGYHLIVTDTEGTERCFFEGLHRSPPDEIKDRMVIKVIEIKTAGLVDTCLEYAGQEVRYRIERKSFSE